MSNTILRFEAPINNNPQQMLELAFGLKNKHWASKADDDLFPPKPIDTVLELLSNGRDEEVSILDWVKLFANKAEWDLQHTQQEVVESSANILSAVVRRAPITHMTLFRSALALEGKEGVFPPVLLEHLDLLNGKLSGGHENVLAVVIAGRDQNYLSIAWKALHHGITVKSLFNRLRLPRCTALIQNTLNCLPDLVAEISIQKYEGWLLTVLTNESINVQLGIAEALLNHHESLSQSPTIVRWVGQHCDPRSETGHWYRLGVEARKSLREIIDISEFFRFKEMVKLISRADVSSELGFDEKTGKLFKSRSLFWEHYKGSMLSMRILMPKRTAGVMREYSSTSSWFDVMRSETNSEAVIFEFEGVFIIEVLRGAASEIRVFCKNTKNSNILSRDPVANLESIRYLHQDGVHDHVVCWQWACEHWLRTNFNLVPDEDIDNFKGLPPSASKYDKSTGLPTPPVEILSKRQKELEAWGVSFFSRERDIGKYGSDGEKADMDEAVIMVDRLQRLGCDSLIREKLQMAASLGNSDAALQITMMVLEDPNSTHQEVDIAERELEKSVDTPKCNVSELLYKRANFYLTKPKLTYGDSSKGYRLMNKSAALCNENARTFLKFNPGRSSNKSVRKQPKSNF